MKISRFIIDKTVHLLGFILQFRKISTTHQRVGEKVYVNLGCGLAVAPGWMNVDASLNALFGGAPVGLLNILYKASGANRYYEKSVYCNLLRENKFFFHDLARSLPFSSGTVDVFYSSHFFEHLFRDDALRLLKEMRIALKPGGIVRIAVPDLAHAIRLYEAGKKVQMLEDYFFVNDLSSYLARHKYMYDFELLNTLLTEAGFSEIKQCKFGKGNAPDLQILDNRPEDTLFIEAYFL